MRGLQRLDISGDVDRLDVDELDNAVLFAIVPTFIAAGGERAVFAFVDFFTAQIRNRNTRAAYAVAVRSFCNWCDVRRLTLETLRTHHVAASRTGFCYLT